ncbi:MAG: YicC family protein [Alphaproteobacteria bacterium]|nr:YicC family protein [Alphaproteobacteria bacterium]MBU1561754.1 YicC family protein [Alphaproteobacteria bacterium]MBU2302972.1 YicC family protein [Alphaproteobacteria bacterium]MBU2368759.1 YicC family protein [Alphaproteobacteria bacterium]
MTGYARATGSVPGASFACEVKSVNGRGLDIRLRLAPGLDALEGDIRQLIGKMVSRGSVTFSLSVERDGAGGELLVNRQALATVLAALDDLKGKVEATAPSLDGILGLKGVLDQRDSPMSAQAEEALVAAILDAASQALVDLVLARRQEGNQIAAILLDRLDQIEALVTQAEQHPARSREVILARLREQVAAIADDITIPEERLAQEALLLATKADIREELDRLVAHIANAGQLIRGGGAVGRRLDFLAQEFNREANTLCSKSNAVELTAIGLDLKAAIDQLREQVQNIE